MSLTRIAVLGGVTLDTIIRTAQVPMSGESVIGTSLEHHPGGKGANVAIAAFRVTHNKSASWIDVVADGKALLPAPWIFNELGDVSIFLNSGVGRDSSGQTMVEHITANGVDTSGVQMFDNASTATAFMIVETDSGESRGISIHGAMDMWRMSDSSSVKCLAADKRPDMIICQLPVPEKIVLEVLSAAHNDNIPIVFNPSPAKHLNVAIYNNLDHVVVNQSEALRLTQVTAIDADDRKSLNAAANFFLRAGVRNIVITLAAKGAYFSTDTGLSGLVPVEEQIQVVDSSGAGDTFVAVYAVECLRQRRTGERNIEKAVRLANKAASKALASMGAQTSSPWANELFLYE